MEVEAVPALGAVAPVVGVVARTHQPHLAAGAWAAPGPVRRPPQSHNRTEVAGLIYRRHRRAARTIGMSTTASLRRLMERRHWLLGVHSCIPTLLHRTAALVQCWTTRGGLSLMVPLAAAAAVGRVPLL